MQNCGDVQVKQVSFKEAFWLWVKVALNSFGGPTGQIAVMHRYLVEEKRWISESRFLHALNYCMLLPGPEAQQLATYIGWLLHKTWGGVVAGTLFVIPGFICLLVLSILYTGYQDLTIVQSLFFGLKPAVLAIVSGSRAAHREKGPQDPAHGGHRRAGLHCDLLLRCAFPHHHFVRRHHRLHRGPLLARCVCRS